MRPVRLQQRLPMTKGCFAALSGRVAENEEVAEAAAEGEEVAEGGEERRPSRRRPEK